VSDDQRELPLFPLNEVVLFPGMPLPLRIFEERYKVMIGACQVTDQLFGVLLIRSGHEVGDPAVPERVGCTARMLRVDRLPDGQMNILTVGEQRFRLLGAPHVAGEGYLLGNIRLSPPDATVAVPKELIDSVVAEWLKYSTAVAAQSALPTPKTPPDPPRDPHRLSYWVGATLNVHPRERQQLLELDDVVSRLEQELKLLRRENHPAVKSIGPFSTN
jgi:ATP-dependent Lon protease